MGLPLTGVGPGGGWSPAVLSGIILWRQAGPNYCYTDKPPATRAGNGSAVYPWTSKKADSDTCTVEQATAGDRPLLRLAGGEYDVRSATDDYMDVTGTGFNGLSGFSIFVSGIADSNPASLDTLVALGDPASQSLGVIRRSAAGGQVWELAGLVVGGVSGVQITSATAVPTGSRFVIGYVLEPGHGSQRQRLYSGSTLIGSANVAGALNATIAGNKRLLTDSFDAVNRTWPGGIYEVVAVGRAITATELSSLANYLA